MSWLAPAAALLACGHLRWVVPRLAEPVETDPLHDGWHKPPYASLTTARAQLAAAAGGLGAGLVAEQAPGLAAAPLLVLAGPTCALVLVDLRTTYLPRMLSWWCAWLMGAAAATSVTLAADPTSLATRLALAAAASTALFWLLWRVTGALGFGDVRLAPVLAVGAAADSWATWELSLLLGTMIGAMWGVATALWRRRHPHPLGQVFPYGPALWLGVWPAVLAHP